MRSPGRSCGAAALAVALAARPAAAFVTSCHQGITTDALDAAAWPLGAAPPPLSGDYVPLLDELVIDVAPQARNFWALSALVGNLYNDLGPNDLKDVAALAEFTARPTLQREHCLRTAEDDGAAGDVQALADCKAFMLEQVAAALGDGDTPDLAATEVARLHLVFRGDADVPFARYAFHIGRATHALQDSFTHTFRSADKRLVMTVLNWVDWLSSGYSEERDGFRHLAALDGCGASSEGGLDRRAAAQQATAELLAAVAGDQGGRAGRLARAGAVIDAWFGIEPGCTAATHWCDAPEQQQTGPIAGCAVAPGQGGSQAAGIIAVLAGISAVSRRRQPRPRRRRPAMAALFAAALMLGPLGGARAAGGHDDATDAGQNGDQHAAKDGDRDPPKEGDKNQSKDGASAQEDSSRGEVKGGVIKKATPEEQRLLGLRRLGVLVQGGIAIDNGAYQMGGGVRYDLGKTWTVGLSAEYNPWFSFETGKLVRGSTNIFAVGVYRLDVRDYLELRLTISAGASILNFDTWAAKSGSVGPYLALSPLGVAIRMGGHLRFLVDPAELAIATPQTKGLPLSYRQHRFSVGLQANF